jgi:hypothetical protein
MYSEFILRKVAFRREGAEGPMAEDHRVLPPFH